MGTGIGRTLRIQSDELRKKLMLNLEKKAMEAPVKILLPLIGFIFPAIFIIIFGPIILTGMF
jgi:tight adherence protein C